MLPRDWELLRFLEEQGFATFQQLRSRFFASKSYCSERVQKLCAFGYIARKPLEAFFYKNQGKQEIRKGYFPHLLNLNLRPGQDIFFVARDFSEGFGKSKRLFKPSMLLHQLILNDIRSFIEEEVLHQWIFNDPKLKVVSTIQSGRNPEIVPDLSIEDGPLKMAIEVERTPKGKSKYFRRFNFFRDSIYSHVIYYYTDENQLRGLLDRAGRDGKFAFAHYKTPNELYSPTLGVLKIHEFIQKKRFS